MSWQINSTGNRRGVKREVQAATTDTDQEQQEAAKALIIAEIDSLPQSVTGFRVEAYGTRQGTISNIYIKIDQVRLAVDAEIIEETPRS